MNWRDALEQKIAIHHFWGTRTGKAFLQSFAMDSLRKGRDQEARFYAEIGAAEQWKLSQAEPIFIDADMVDLITHAAESFDPEPLEWEDFLIPFGFVLMEKPFVLQDARGKTISYRAWSFGPSVTDGEDGEEIPSGQGALFTWYTHRDDPDDWVPKPDDPNYDPAMAFRDKGFAPYPLTMGHSAHWVFGEDFTRWEKAAEGVKDGNPGQMQTSWRNLWALTQVALRLMQQTISTKEKRDVGRPAARRAKRAGHPEREVTVITLRRLKQAAESNREVEWSHRWLVRGHWKNQWYPSIQRHRRIWIAPFIKGPEDKELILKDVRAFELRR